MLYLSLVTLYVNSVPFMIYPRLVLSMKGYGTVPGGFYTDRDDSGFRLLLFSGPAADSVVYELSGATLPTMSSHT